jgi:HEAT repeat protein
MTRDNLEQALTAQDPEVRRLAVGELTRLGAESTAALVRALGDEDWRVRKEATQAIIDMPPSKELAQAVTKALEPNDNVGLRNAAVETLAALGQSAVEALTEASTSLDVDGRKLAADALGQSRHPSAVLLLKALAGDVDLNVRVAALEALGHVGSSCTVEFADILYSAMRAREPIERLSALEAANELGLSLDWRRIRTLLGEPCLQRAIWSAACRMNDPDSAEMLTRVVDECLESEFPLAVLALANRISRDEQALPIARLTLVTLRAERRHWLARLLSGELVEHRQAALLVVAAIGDAESAQAVLDIIDDDSLAATAELALSLLGRAASALLCERASVASSPRTQALAIGMLVRVVGSAPDTDAFATVASALDSENASVLRAAFEFLERNSDENCLERAYLCFERAAKIVETSAVVALQSMVNRHPNFAARLILNSSVDGPNTLAAVVTMATLIAIPGYDRSVDTEFLSRALAHESPHVRRGALEALAMCGHASSTDIALFALTDEESEVRRAAVRALGRATDVSAIERLIDIMRVSDDLDLVVEAIRALGASDNPRALPVLRPVARGGAPAVAVAAVEAIAQLHDPRRIDALIDSLSHADGEVVKASLQMLARETDLRAGAHLGACLDHEAWDVRRLAADLLGRIGGEVANGLLRTKLAIETEPLVREALLRALGDVEVTTYVRRNTPGVDPGSWRPR